MPWCPARWDPPWGLQYLTRKVHNQPSTTGGIKLTRNRRTSLGTRPCHTIWLASCGWIREWMSTGMSMTLNFITLGLITKKDITINTLQRTILICTPTPTPTKVIKLFIPGQLCQSASSCTRHTLLHIFLLECNHPLTILTQTRLSSYSKLSHNIFLTGWWLRRISQKEFDINFGCYSCIW